MSLKPFEKYPLQHISLYQLTIEEGTSFNDHKGIIKSINNDLAAEFYDIQIRYYVTLNFVDTKFQLC